MFLKMTKILLAAYAPSIFRQIAGSIGVLPSSMGRGACVVLVLLSMPVCTFEKRCVWPCALWSLSAGAAAGSRWQMHIMMPGCWCRRRVLPPDVCHVCLRAWVLVPLRYLRSIPQIARAIGVLTSSSGKGACVPFGACVLMQGAAAKCLRHGGWCRCRVPLPDA